MKRIHLIIFILLLCAGGYAQGLKKFSEGGKYGFRNAEGKVVIPAKYYDMGDFSEGLVAAEVTGIKYQVGQRWGYIDETGAEVIPPTYYNAKNFSEGLAAVCGEHGYGYIDKSGNVVIPMKYTDGFDFSGGVARVLYANNWIYIDKTGTTELCTEPIAIYIEQARNYCAKLNKESGNSGPFRIVSPYVVISLGDDCEKTNVNNSFGYVDKYEYKSFNDYLSNGVKTVIFTYSYPDATQTYHAYNNHENTRTVTSYGTFIVYFDLARKEITGHDILRGPSFPSTIDGYSGNSIGNGDVKNRIGSRLAGPEQ